MGDPIQGYAHNHTLRLVLTESQRNLISSEAIASGEHTETFKISIEEFDKNELSIVAFVNNLGASFAEHDVPSFVLIAYSNLKRVRTTG